MIRHSAKTHPGRRRENNEDSMLAAADHGLFVVADGVGGRAAGEVASALTIEVFEAEAPSLAAAVAAYARTRDYERRNAVLELLEEVCQKASQRVYEEGERTHRRGMTTTVVVALVGGGAAFLAHVGDSRIYLVRDGLIRQLTEDHSMINEMVRSGGLSADEARRSPYRSVITRALGLHPTIKVDLMSVEILPGDRLVLCSDGLSDPVDLEDIERLVGENEVEPATEALIEAALDAGGPDNVTAIVVEPEATRETEAARARAQIMQDLFLFQGLPFHTRLRVSRICEERFFGPGDILVKEGELGDSMFVVVQGTLVVSRGGISLARIGPGEHFGELGLLEAQARSATVTGESWGSAIVVRRTHLLDLCNRDPALGNAVLWRLLATLGARLQSANTMAVRAVSEGDTVKLERE
jgi:serine/threonine protein phosphatase PrpC